MRSCQKKQVECVGAISQPPPMRNPFKYFKTSPEIIRLAVLMYIRFPL